MIDLAIRRNIIALFFLQGGNYLVPLLTLPWLTRVLGVDAYGQLGFITAFIAYFVLLVDWGFSLSATKQVSIEREDKDARSRIFWQTFIARGILAVLGFLILLVLFIFVPRIWSQANLYLLAYLAVLGVMLTPAFYYQGLERMGKMALVNTVVRLLSIPCIFFFVNGTSDLGLAIGIQSGFIFLAGLVNFSILLLEKEVLWTLPKTSHVHGALKAGWPLFLSTASISLYTNSNIVILGLVANTAAVAYFTAAQTVIRACQGLYGPISQAFFPRISHLFHHARESGFLMLRQVMIFQGTLTLLSSAILYLSAPYIVAILFGQEFILGISVLRWLSPLLFLIGLSNVFGIQGMVPLGHTSPFTQILLASGLLNVLFMLPLGYWFGANGAAISVLITELVVTILMALYIRSIEPKLFKLQA